MQTMTATAIMVAAAANTVGKSRNIIQLFSEETNDFDFLDLQLSQQAQWSCDFNP
jgi:hypothetical protein